MPITVLEFRCLVLREKAQRWVEEDLSSLYKLPFILETHNFINCTLVFLFKFISIVRFAHTNLQNEPRNL